jgi:hypothetical protein
MNPSPRSRRPSAEVQAAREALLATDLRQRVDYRRKQFAAAMVHVIKQPVSHKSKHLIGLQDALREALVHVEILIEQTQKLEKAERGSI